MLSVSILLRFVVFLFFLEVVLSAAPSTSNTLTKTVSKTFTNTVTKTVSGSNLFVSASQTGSLPPSLSVTNTHSAAPLLFCGNYAPFTLLNGLSSTRTAASFAVPLVEISQFPALYGCTPKEATSNESLAIFSYSADSPPFLSTSHFLEHERLVLSSDFTFESEDGLSQLTLATISTSKEKFVNFSMEYSNNYPYVLESISIFGHGFSSFTSLIPRWLLLNIDPNLLLDENEEEIEIVEEDEEEDEEEIENVSSFSEFITFSNGDPTFPNLPTQIVRHLPRKTITVNINYLSISNGGNNYVSQITTTGPRGQTNSAYIYYNRQLTQITKICVVSCTAFSYDAFGRLLSVSENGIVLDAYHYTGNQMSSAKFNSAGSWSFLNE